MKTGIFLFTLMMIFMSLSPTNAWGLTVSKVIRINPGDTILSSQLTEKDHDMYVGSHIGTKGLIIVKNGGDFVLKIDDLDPASLAAGKNNCIVISRNGTYNFAFYKLHDPQLFILELLVDYHGHPFFEGKEIEMNSIIPINSDKDLEKKDYDSFGEYELVDCQHLL